MVAVNIMRVLFLIFGAALMVHPAGNVLAASQLTIYTAAPQAEFKKIESAFRTEINNVEIRWVRDSTKGISKRLRAESRQPKADIVWGVAASEIADLAANGYFLPYTPKDFASLDRRYSDGQTPPRWIGLRVWANALCVNRDLMAAQKLKMPERWGDLLNPAFKKRILALDPSGSRTGLMTVSGWMSLWGDDGAWRFMEGLHRNVIIYMRSGNAPCDLVARGIYPIGISYAYRAAKYIAKGRPIKLIVPGDGVGWDVEAIAIVKGTPYVEAARAFADWIIGQTAMKLQSRQFGLMARQKNSSDVRFYPKKLNDALVPINFEKRASERKNILAEWRLRFGAKVEPEQ
ncbi:MAG: extracellular solute-binding protein [Candidatus Latescibacterota bacterium]